MSHHPSIDMLEAYALGQLDIGHSIAVSAHLEFCPACRSQLFRLEELAGQQLHNLPESEPYGLDTNANDAASGHWDDMLEKITKMPQISARPTSPALLCSPKVDIDGVSLRVPKALHHLLKSHPEWRSYAGKVYSLPLHNEESSRVNLLYIGQNVLVPQHTHKGTEATLVLHGGFSDEDGEYHAGDFILRDASIRHSPKTAVGQNCLCLTVLTDSMVFTQGIARLFNLFGRGVYP